MTKDILYKRMQYLKKKQLIANKVVNLGEFRDLLRPAKTPHLLVVDQDEFNSQTLKRILEDHAYKLEFVEDGLALSKVMAHYTPDLILLNTNLPWVNGFEIGRLLKNQSKFKNIPLIYMAEKPTSEDIKSSLDIGAVDFLHKPFELSVLLNMLTTHTHSESVKF